MYVRSELRHSEAVKLLIKAGADINTQDIIGYSALMRATENNHFEVISILLKAGADVNAKDDEGKTALMFAAKYCENPEVTEILIDAGAEDAIDNNGQSALIMAADSGHADVILALIEAGTDATLRDKLGNMAVDYARKRDKLLGSDALKRLEKLSK